MSGEGPDGEDGERPVRAGATGPEHGCDATPEGETLGSAGGSHPRTGVPIVCTACASYAVICGHLR